MTKLFPISLKTLTYIGPLGAGADQTAKADLNNTVIPWRMNLMSPRVKKADDDDRMNKAEQVFLDIKGKMEE